MLKKSTALKLRVPESGLYGVLLERISFCKKPHEEIIGFSALFSKLSVSFQLPKKKVWELLYLLHDLGIIEIICGHGIKLKFELEK